MGVEKDKENIHVDPMLLFSRLLALIEREREREREREEEIPEYFRFELKAFATFLFQNGMMHIFLIHIFIPF